MEKENLNETFEDLEDLHNNELDDIVLEKYEKKNRIKKYLLIGGSILLIFIIVISIVKIVTDSSSAPQEALIEEQTSSISSVEDNYEEEVPIVSESEKEPSDEEFKKVIDDVMKKEKSLEKKELAPSKSTTHVQKPQQKSAPSKRTSEPKKITPRQNNKVTSQKTVTQIKKSSPKTAAKGNVYIQVGAFLKYDPDKEFLHTIKRQGFNYIVKTYNLNGKIVKRVYIGPFTSKKEAAKYLPKVRKTISKNAFVTKVGR